MGVQNRQVDGKRRRRTELFDRGPQSVKRKYLKHIT